MSERRIPCPGCATRKRLSIDNERWRPCEMCGSVRDGTIPDRRAPSAAERIVDAIKLQIVDVTIANIKKGGDETRAYLQAYTEVHNLIRAIEQEAERG